MADHFSSQELSVLVAQGARSLEGQRLLDHFGRGCQACWRLLTEFAATCEAAVEDHEEPAVAPDVRSLERCLAFLAPRPANAPPRAAHLRPIHRHVLAQTCGTTTDVTKALTFRRLVLEECRHQSLQASSAAIEQLRWAMASLPDDELARQAPGRTLALRGLSWAYLADSYRFVGRGFEADAAFTTARELLDAVGRDAEIRATCFELEADQARHRGDMRSAFHCLRSARELLKDCAIPSRRAEPLLRLGLVRLRIGDTDQAIEEFRAALAELPRGLHPRLRLDALQHLAAAEITLRRFDAARAAITEADRECADVLTWELLKARRAWLWGIVHLEAREAEAEARLREAAELFVDTAQSLVDLGRHYVLHRQDGGLRQVAQELGELVRRSSLSLDQWRTILGQAAKIGIERCCLLGPCDEPTGELVN